VGFDFLDAQLPGDEDGEEAGGLPFPVSPSLGREKKRIYVSEELPPASTYFNWFSPDNPAPKRTHITL